MAFLELKHIAKTYSTRPVLKDVSLSVEEGEFVSIVGSSASGKTTLLKIASGLVDATSGSVTLGGVPVTEFSTQAAIVFQNYSLLPWLSALENVRLAVEGAFPGWSRQKHTDHSQRYLQLVGLGTAGLKKPSQLSGGMRQRVAIARAFAVQPKILFLDEPFGALDALTRASLQKELAQLCSAAETPVTALMITNSVDEAILLSDRILALSRGPAASLSPAVPITLPRPRQSDLLLRNDHAVRIRARLADFLTGVNHGTPAARPTGTRVTSNVPVEAA